MRKKRPIRKRGASRKPPPNFPTDPDLYGDPENWKFPLDTPRRAKLARRFFSMERSRRRYTEEERLYIDNRIDLALERFGVDPREFQEVVGDSERTPDLVFPEDANPEDISLDELLLHFVGSKRIESSREIGDDRVRIDKVTDEYIVARIKEYLIKIDIKSRVFAHDCGDWIAWMSKKLMCKHAAKLLTNIDSKIATRILRDLYKKKDGWTFSAMPREMFA
ncbi:MAG: hypothetical protein ACE5IJ_04980 [Thermoplasmata archaeon]